MNERIAWLIERQNVSGFHEYMKGRIETTPTWTANAFEAAQFTSHEDAAQQLTQFPVGTFARCSIIQHGFEGA